MKHHKSTRHKHSFCESHILRSQGFEQPTVAAVSGLSRVGLALAGVGTAVLDWVSLSSRFLSLFVTATRLSISLRYDDTGL